MAALLLFIAGGVDAIAFVVLKGNFVAFMSGNTTILGSSIAGGASASVALTGALLAIFFGGCVLGAMIGRWGGAGAVTLVLVAVAVTMLVGAAVASAGAVTGGMLVIALSSGLINSALTAASSVHVGLTYVTGTLVKSAHQLVDGIGGGRRWEWWKTFRMWLVFIVGAFVGGWALHRVGIGALWGAVGLAAVVPVVRLIVAGSRDRDGAGV